jgi:hypothetical protein
MALLAPGLAHACRSVQSHRYVVLRDPPARLPAGATLIKVRLTGDQIYDQRAVENGARALILAGRGAGRTVRLKPGLWTSCSAWAEQGPVGYVVGWARPRSIFEAVEYRSRPYRTPGEENSTGYKRTGAEPR